MGKFLISRTNFQTIYRKISTIICTPTLENWNLRVMYVFFPLTKEVLGNPIQLVGAFAWKAGIVLSDMVKYVKK